MFYFFGGLTIFWFIAWLLLVFNKPSEHPFITPGEKDFINAALIHADQAKVGESCVVQLLHPGGVSHMFSVLFSGKPCSTIAVEAHPDIAAILGVSCRPHGEQLWQMDHVGPAAYLHEEHTSLRDTSSKVSSNIWKPAALSFLSIMWIFVSHCSGSKLYFRLEWISVGSALRRHVHIGNNLWKFRGYSEVKRNFVYYDCSKNVELHR